MFALSSPAKSTLDVKSRNRLKSIIVALTAVGALGWLELEITTVIAVVLLSAIAAIRLWSSVGKDIGIVELAGFLAVFQWVICPFVAYRFPLYQSSEYAMNGTSEWYFSYAVPGTAMFLAGMYLAQLWKPARIPDISDITPAQYSVAYSLATLAVVSDLLIPFTPSSIGFVIKILSDLKFGAIVLFMYSKHPFRYLIIAVLSAFIFIRSRNTGMFHEPLLWSALFVVYFFYRYRNYRQTYRLAFAKLAVVVFGGISVISLQMVKSEFRDSLSRGDDVSIVRMTIEKALDFESFYEPTNLANLLIRFNQGWIVSRVLNNVPTYEPHFQGRSFLTAVETVLMPRVLFPSRPPVEISKRFYQFTGVRINDTTCMGISLLGEAYGNFGRLGGCITMLVLGGIFSGAVQYTRVLMWRSPLLFFLLGVIFSEPIKAETDTTLVLNYIFKALIVVVAVVYVFRHSFDKSGISKTSPMPTTQS